MQPRVFRGIGIARSAVRVASIATLYAGAFAVLWGLGLAVRGWQGWAILAVPLGLIVALRSWAWRRVSVEVSAGMLRYEGASPAHDFEVELARIEASYFDSTLSRRPLVLVLADGDERICGDLSERASRQLCAHLRELGVPPLRGAGRLPTRTEDGSSDPRFRRS